MTPSIIMMLSSAVIQCRYPLPNSVSAYGKTKLSHEILVSMSACQYCKHVVDDVVADIAEDIVDDAVDDTVYVVVGDSLITSLMA